MMMMMMIIIISSSSSSITIIILMILTLKGAICGFFSFLIESGADPDLHAHLATLLMHVARRNSTSVIWAEFKSHLQFSMFID